MAAKSWKQGWVTSQAEGCTATATKIKKKEVRQGLLVLVLVVVVVVVLCCWCWLSPAGGHVVCHGGDLGLQLGWQTKQANRV